LSLVALYGRLYLLVWSVLGLSFHSYTCLTPALSDDTAEKVLPGGDPERRELRGFVFHQDDLYVVCNGYQDFSDILRYTPSNSFNGDSLLDCTPVGNGLWSSGETVSSIFHPYQIVFKLQGN
jgi:hypothetical protein